MNSAAPTFVQGIVLVTFPAAAAGFTRAE